LSLRDRDLVSIQEVRELVARATEAQKRFAAFSQEQVDEIVEACAAAALAASEQLARLACEETGYGNVPDKMIKNRVGAVEVPRAIRGMRTVGIIREDQEKGIVEVATPVGVVAAIIPCTNPTSTAIYKTLISLKARNAVVLSPHPTAIRCICTTADVLYKAALRAGAPEGLIGCMTHTTMQGTQELLRHRDVGVILATGGTGLVRAAYSSGKPAYGVGPGNVPAYIERTANVHKAVADVFAGKTFDYGTICSSEQHILCDEAIAELVLEECRRQGAYFLASDEAQRLGALVYRPGATAPNPQIVGRAATVLAEMAGIKVPRETRVLIARLNPDQVGREHPLSAEKLSPILALYVVRDTSAAIELTTRLLRFGGAGHTAAVHTQTESVAKQFGAAVPAFRVCVNTSAVHGSIGYSTNLFPAMTLGCGALGSNITSDNIGPHHLMNIKRIAWESRGIAHRTIPADRRLIAESSSGSDAPSSMEQPFKSVQGPPAPAAASAAASASPAPAAASPLPSPSPLDPAFIARAVEDVMQQLGIPRGAALAAPASAEGGRPASASEKDAGLKAGAMTQEAKPAVIASPAPEIVARVFSEKGHTHNPASTNPSPAAAPSAAQALPVTSNLQPPTSEFVSEADVRAAMRKGEKIYVGPKSIVTPAARDLGNTHGVLVETKPTS
jgi:acetaldehyde dehydrogenase (acetylating)